MANVQPENGYTKIANEILEALARTALNGTQRRILDVLFRATYGFNKKHHDISETYLSKATGVSKRQIQKELKRMIQFNIILVVKAPTARQPRIIAFNKNYESWEANKKTPDVKKDTSRGVQKDTQKRNNKKESLLIINAHKFYQDNFGLITPFISESMNNWLDDGVDEALIVKLMQEALSRNVRNWAYVNKAISTNFDKDIKTFEQYEASQFERQERTRKAKAKPKATTDKETDSANIFLQIGRSEGLW
jgi:phage replication O-like protein O